MSELENLTFNEELRIKFQLSILKRQVEILATFVPDLLLTHTLEDLERTHYFGAVVLYSEISGFDSLCDKYNKTGKGGIYRLTTTLNAYIGAIYEIIYAFGGDMAQFSGEEFLAIWKSDPNKHLHEILHHVLVCARLLQKTLGDFTTEVSVKLKLKLIVASGNLTFFVVGKEVRHFLVKGHPIEEIIHAKKVAGFNNVLLTPSAWAYLNPDGYLFLNCGSGYKMILNIKYQYREKVKEEKYLKKEEAVLKLCQKHMTHRELLHSQRRFDDTSTDARITERFNQNLPQRNSVKSASQYWKLDDLKPFIITPVQEQIQEKQLVDHLTEIREVTVQFISVVSKKGKIDKVKSTLNKFLIVITSISQSFLGIVRKASLLDKDTKILVFFGLRGIKHELESKNALQSAYRTRKQLLQLEEVQSVSIGVSNGLVYCGVVGHPYRRNYTVIGTPVNKAEKMMLQYKDKITCDFSTFRNSKLSSSYFKSKDNPNCEADDFNCVFEYDEEFKDILFEEKPLRPVLGRGSILDYINVVINHENFFDSVFGVCLKGLEKIGLSTILLAILRQCLEAGHNVATIELMTASQRPYFCVSALYSQLYNIHAQADSSTTHIIKNLPRELWEFHEMLQVGTRNFGLGEDRRKWYYEKFTQVCKGSKTGVTVCLIDNVQFIDSKSFQILDRALNEGNLKLICAGNFDEDSWYVLWRFYMSQHISVVDVEPLNDTYIAPIVCHFLDVRGVPIHLIHLLARTCNGRPGWIESCLLRLVNTSSLEIEYTVRSNDIKGNYIFPENCLLYLSSEDLESNPNVVRIAKIKESYDLKNNLTLSAISLDLFDSFTASQQIIIKTGAVLGELFTRWLLLIILKCPNERTFINALVNLFEEDVFDCGSKYIQAHGIGVKKLECFCYGNDKHEKDGYPNYAYCKLIHFKNKSLRTLAYDLLPTNHRKELHLKATEVLENQSNICPSCLRDNSASIIILSKFSDLEKACNPSEDKKKETEDSNKLTTNTVKALIREEIKEQHEQGTAKESDPKKIIKRKTWSLTDCFCFEILTKVYSDLVHHSKCAGHLGKRIFYLMQYGSILMAMNEPEEAIPLLSEASELCMIESNQQYFLTNEFRKLSLGKIHILLAQVHLALENVTIAKNHLMISLRQYGIPMTVMTHTIPHKIFHGRIWLRPPNPHIYKLKNHPLVKCDFGLCLNVMANILVKEGNWPLAKLAASRSLALLRDNNNNVDILCDAYSNAIELYNYFGDGHVCEKLERNINRDFLKFYCRNSTLELYAMCRLVSVIFQARTMSGKLLASIRIGFRAVEINLVMQSVILLVDIMPILMTLLLMRKRIEEAVCMARLLCGYAKKYEPKALLGYFGFCLELNIETSFSLEDINNVNFFVEEHFGKNKKPTSSMENKLLIYLHAHYLRNSRVSKAMQWKERYDPEIDNIISISSIMNLMKFTECNLLMMGLGNDSLSIKETMDITKMYLKRCKGAAKKWKLFMPRYLHLQAYFYQIKRRGRLINKFLNRALETAKRQENVLEESWIKLNATTWKSELNFFGEVKYYDWTAAKTTSVEEWSQLMYALPSY